MAIDINESKRQLLQFLNDNHAGVLATASNLGKPHAATVYITYDQELNLYFVTRKNTQKSQNLQSNNQVALAVYNAASQTTLQAEGTAIEVTQPQKVQWIFNDIWRIASQTSATNPPPQTQLLGAGDYVAYQLSTPSLRLATYAQPSSSRSEDIFANIPTQESSHFNAYGSRQD